MSGAPTPVQARRRFVGLTALRWLPLGASVPVTVLLASARGLSPADIGVVLAVCSTTTLVLELPTGGLADAIGHRPVLVVSGLLTTAGLLAMALAGGTATFALAWGLLGAGRALDSGPLEAWYVDAVHATDPSADVASGLSRAAAANGLGLAVGAALGGSQPLVAGTPGAAGLAVPLVLAAALTGVSVAAVAVLVVPLRAPSGSGVAVLTVGLRELPAVLRDTGLLVHRDRVLQRLLVISSATGVALVSIELLGPLHLAGLAGGRTEGAAVFGIVMAVSFTAAGLGSLSAPAARRAARGSVAWVSGVSAVLAALSVAAVALAPGPTVAATAVVLFYLLNAIGWPVRQQLLHERTTSSRRSTTASARSLALMSGGLLGNLLLPRLAEVAGTAAGLLAGAAAVLVIALLSPGLRRARHPAGSAGDRSEVDRVQPAPRG